MLIVVEGVDASGKSTLLEASRTIRDRYFVLVRHSCRPLRPEHITSLLKQTEDTGIDVVLDRHPLISEPIYGPILRNHDLARDWSKGDDWMVTSWIKTIDRIVYCRPPIEVIKANLGNKLQLAGVEENLTKLLSAYDLRMSELKAMGIPIVRYDYSYEPNPDIEMLLFGEHK
jgi:hypothetical protein